MRPGDISFAYTHTRRIAVGTGARGFSLHAATRIDADDRAGLERLARYVTRPPLAAGRLQIIDDEHLTFRLKTPWSDGTCFLVLSPLELIEKLAALVPPPRLNLIRYHGVLAPNARDRKHIVPDAPLTDEPSIRPTAVDTPQARAQRLSWAALLARVFDIDISVCTACGGRMRIIATLTEAASIRRYLEGVGLPAEPPLIAPSPATPAATQPRLRRLKNSTAHPPGIDHRRHDGELRSKITPPTLQDPFPLHPRS